LITRNCTAFLFIPQEKYPIIPTIIAWLFPKKPIEENEKL